MHSHNYIYIYIDTHTHIQKELIRVIDLNFILYIQSLMKYGHRPEIQLLHDIDMRA